MIQNYSLENKITILKCFTSRFQSTHLFTLDHSDVTIDVDDMEIQSHLNDIYQYEIEGDSDFFDFQLIFEINRSQRSWSNHLRMLRHVDDIEGTYRKKNKRQLSLTQALKNTLKKLKKSAKIRNYN